MTSRVSVVEADLARDDHARAVRDLTTEYAEDTMGAGRPIADDVLARLVPGLRAHPAALVFLGYDGGEAVGIATCFLGFSTFSARPLVNIHDLAVSARARRRGVGRALLGAVEAKARALGCAKVTLEVGDRNDRARALYHACGFEQASAGPGAGAALFYAKPL